MIKDKQELQAYLNKVLEKITSEEVALADVHAVSRALMICTEVVGNRGSKSQKIKIANLAIEFSKFVTICEEERQGEFSEDCCIAINAFTKYWDKLEHQILLPITPKVVQDAVNSVDAMLAESGVFNLGAQS
jgi:hypothetical protein